MMEQSRRSKPPPTPTPRSFNLWVQTWRLYELRVSVSALDVTSAVSNLRLYWTPPAALSPSRRRCRRLLLLVERLLESTRRRGADTFICLCIWHRARVTLKSWTRSDRSAEASPFCFSFGCDNITLSQLEAPHLLVFIHWFIFLWFYF